MVPFAMAVNNVPCGILAQPPQAFTSGVCLLACLLSMSLRQHNTAVSMPPKRRACCSSILGVPCWVLTMARHRAGQTFKTEVTSAGEKIRGGPLNPRADLSLVPLWDPFIARPANRIPPPRLSSDGRRTVSGFNLHCSLSASAADVAVARQSDNGQLLCNAVRVSHMAGWADQWPPYTIVLVARGQLDGTRNRWLSASDSLLENRESSRDNWPLWQAPC
jgi:hypothetical protein